MSSDQAGPPDNLFSNKRDYAVALARAGLGLVPYVGPLAAEVITTLIPDQRLDRIVRYAQALELRLIAVEADRVQARFHEPEFLDLFEDSLWQTARAATQERIEYIASLISRSLSDEELDYARYKKLLSLLQDLDDVEVILLRAVSRDDLSDEDFVERHQKLLAAPAVHLGSSDEEVDARAIYDSRINHLLRLGLLRQRFQMPKKGEAPVFDPSTGALRAHRRELTTLGRLLLNHIGLLSAEEEES